MPKYLHLDIPEPCHEDWHKMSPEAQGRYCGSCQKTVTDFTSMSDTQLVALFYFLLLYLLAAIVQQAVGQLQNLFLNIT
jgi:hypothetical protein